MRTKTSIGALALGTGMIFAATTCTTGPEAQGEKPKAVDEFIVDTPPTDQRIHTTRSLIAQTWQNNPENAPPLPRIELLKIAIEAALTEEQSSNYRLDIHMGTGSGDLIKITDTSNNVEICYVYHRDGTDWIINAGNQDYAVADENFSRLLELLSFSEDFTNEETVREAARVVVDRMLKTPQGTEVTISPERIISANMGRASEIRP